MYENSDHWEGIPDVLFDNSIHVPLGRDALLQLHSGMGKADTEFTHTYTRKQSSCTQSSCTQSSCTKSSCTQSPSYTCKHKPPSAICTTINVETYLELLPDDVLGNILSYLHWKEKEWFLTAFPELGYALNSATAWPRFENDRAYAMENLYMYIYFPQMLSLEKNVIRKYGQYFQTCTIRLHRLSEYDEKKEDDLSLLVTVAKHCPQLKAIHIIHPSDVSVSQLSYSNQLYLQPIHTMVMRKCHKFKISLSRLFYSSIDNVDTGIVSYMTYLTKFNLISNIVSLDFSHGLICDGNFRVVHELKQCTQLKTLKCPVQSLSTSVLKTLSQGNLTHLYLVKDDHTSDMNFFEKLSIDWEAIRRHIPSHLHAFFNVHYIVRNITFSVQDLVPNPFLKSLVFDNLSSNIPATFLHKVADLYGPTLHTLAFCSNYWEFLMHFTDLDRIDNTFKYVAEKCERLHIFLSCLSLPSSALMSMAVNSKTLSTVRVYRENVSLTSEVKFTQSMALALRCSSWCMLKKGDNIYNIPGIDCRLLFDNCFKEI